MKGLLLQDKKQKRKKGVSEIVSYTLLIVIAIGVSSLVYYFLMLQTPKEKTECKEGISLGIDRLEFSCDSKKLTLVLLNNGRFKVDAAYVRLGEEGKSVRYWINDPDKDDEGKSVTDSDEKREDKFYLSSADSTLNSGLAPNKVSLSRYHSTIPLIKITEDIKDKNFILEIEPAIISETTGKLAACETAVITQKITCS